MKARSAEAERMLYLRPFPRAAEDERDLLEVVHEELLRLLVHVARSPACEHAVVGEELLELLGQRRMGDAAAADAEQLISS